MNVRRASHISADAAEGSTPSRAPSDGRAKDCENSDPLPVKPEGHTLSDRELAVLCVVLCRLCTNVA